MMYGYTDRIIDSIEEMVATDTAGIWADMEMMGDESDSEKWRTKLESIAEEYLMSSRFALMRMFRDRAKAQGLAAELPEPAASADITMESARTLSPEEHTAWLQYLLDVAGPSPQEDPDLHERILSRAWHDTESANAVMIRNLPEKVKQNSKKFQQQTARIEKENKKHYGPGFTRKEAFQLGHILRFTLEEMQRYLLRVFDVDDGFRMNRSGDLIEAYCFLTDATCHRAALLREQYLEKARDIAKQDNRERSRNWTRQTAGGLLERVEIWKRNPQTQDENFLSWLTDRASGLDLPSHTACRIYRNLAAYAYAGGLPYETDLLEELLHICDMDEDSEEALEYLFSDGSVSGEKCRQVAEQLYRDNKEITEPSMKDNTKPWSVITTRKDRELSVSYGTVNSSRTRIQSLLLGTEEVEKGDLLYLLWFTYNLVWSDTGETSRHVIYDRIFDLKEAADAFLAGALLPAFYPPHLLEQSMLLSIIHAGKTGTDPSVVYGCALQALRGSRERETGSRKHTLQEQIDIVTQHREGMTLKQCAVLNGISEKTLSQWQEKLIRQGYISAQRE